MAISERAPQLQPEYPQPLDAVSMQGMLNAVPRRVRRDVETELLGIWAQPNKEDALTHLTAFKAKYGKLYPEAVRSLAEEEEKTLTFYEFPQPMHRYIRKKASLTHSKASVTPPT